MSFHIQTYKTKYYLVSDGKETDGSLVATIPESEFNPDTTVRILVHILNPLTMVAWQSVMVPPVGEIPVMGTVQSNKVNDLYVGYKSVGWSSAPPTEQRLTRTLGWWRIVPCLDQRGSWLELRLNRR